MRVVQIFITMKYLPRDKTRLENPFNSTANTDLSHTLLFVKLIYFQNDVEKIIQEVICTKCFTNTEWM